MAVGHGEVGRIVRHGMTLVLDTHTRIRHREVPGHVLRHGNALNRVAFAIIGSGIERFFQAHVGIERIIARTDDLLRVREIDGYGYFGFLGEEFAQFHVGRHRVCFLRIGAALHHALLQSAKTVGNVTPGEVDRTEVRQLHVHGARCGPTALIVGVAQSQLVHPHLARLQSAGQVAHTDNHGLHLAQRRVAHDAHAVVGLVGIVVGEQLRKRSASRRTGFVAGAFQIGEHGEVYVEHVLLRPHQRTVGRHIPAIGTGWRKLQGDEILVVVVLIVAAQTNEHSQLIVLQLRAVRHKVVGMHKHLYVLVLAQVEVGGLIDSLRFVLAQVLHCEAESLLVILCQLRLIGISGTVDARRQYVGHGGTLGILLHVDGAHLQLSGLCPSRCLQTLLVLSPLATHQVERSESQHDILLEACEEHAHEANAGEIADAAFLLLRCRQRDAVLIPAHGLLLSIAQLHIVVAVIYNIGILALVAVVISLDIVVADGNTVLIVALIFVEGEVLIDVLHVGACLVTGVVALGLVVGCRRVALRIVDALVALHDGAALIVVVTATEVVIVVACRVVAPSLKHAVVGHDAADGVEPFLVSSVCAFLLVVQSVEAHVLQRARTAGRGEGVCLCGLRGNLTPLRSGERLGAIDGHAALIELLAVAQHILAHLAQVDIQVARTLRSRSVCARIYIRIEQPELYILNVGLFKVGGLQSAHHAAPLLCRVLQRTVGIELSGQVVRATLLGIVGQVEHGQR